MDKGVKKYLRSHQLRSSHSSENINYFITTNGTITKSMTFLLNYQKSLSNYLHNNDRDYHYYDYYSIDDYQLKWRIVI